METCGPLFFNAVAALLLGAAAAPWCAAQAVAPASAAAASASPAAASSSPPARAPGKIYQQRQKDGSILFTDRPPAADAVTERSWAVPAEDPALAEKRREQARQEARQDAQAVNERVQRQIERDREREDALALQRMRLSEALAQRDAEAARSDRERADRDRAAMPPLIVVVPGQRPPHRQPPYGDGVVRRRPPEVRPAPVPAPRPPPLLCSGKAADCNPGSEPGRAGFSPR
jgi:hypothetical protein